MATGEYVVALIAGLPSLAVGALAYRRSLKVDAVAAQSGVATESREGTAQIIEGLNRLIDQLQEEVRYLAERSRTLMTDCDDLRKRLNELQLKHDTPPPGADG